MGAIRLQGWLDTGTDWSLVKPSARQQKPMQEPLSKRCFILAQVAAAGQLIKKADLDPPAPAGDCLNIADIW